MNNVHFARKLLRKCRRTLIFGMAGLHLQAHRNHASVYLGSEYGGWAITPDLINADSIVYSAGVGTDTTFDIELIEQFGVVVHAFDPTPASIAWVAEQAFDSRFKMHPFGFAGIDGEITLYAPCDSSHISHSFTQTQTQTQTTNLRAPVRTIKSTMNQFGHDRLDLLKMDIEGAEYGVIESLLDGNIFPRQLLVEYHHRVHNLPFGETLRTHRNILQRGYTLFYLSDLGDEFCYVKK